MIRPFSHERLLPHGRSSVFRKSFLRFFTHFEGGKAHAVTCSVLPSMCILREHTCSSHKLYRTATVRSPLWCRMPQKVVSSLSRERAFMAWSTAIGEYAHVHPASDTGKEAAGRSQHRKKNQDRSSIGTYSAESGPV